jgi:hypothetical protein
MNDFSDLSPAQEAAALAIKTLLDSAALSGADLGEAALKVIEVASLIADDLEPEAEIEAAMQRGIAQARSAGRH